MKSESEIQQLIQLEAAKHGCILLRNNSGAFEDANGRLVRFGLGNTSKYIPFRSSDLIGWTTVTIDMSHIGQTLAVFTAIEVKKEDWKPSTKCEREEGQMKFINWVLTKGGIAGMVKSVDDFIKVLRK